MTDISLKDQSTVTQLSLPGLIVEPDWLAQHLDHPALRLLDVRTPDNYQAGHIPRAVQVDLPALTGTVGGVLGMLVPREDFAARMGHLGVDESKTVVLYDDNWGMPAARVLWALARYGHGQAAVLTGGSDRWQQEGRPWTTEPFVPPLAEFIPRPQNEQIAEHAWLRQRLDQPDELVLLDTRTPGEFGQGHLPEALCWDWMNGVPLKSWDTLKPAEELRTELTDLGVTPDQEIVTYCRSGARAAHTYLLLRQLGYPRVRLYDGSWLEWAQKEGGNS